MSEPPIPAVTVSRDELVLAWPAIGLAHAVLVFRDGGVELAVRPEGAVIGKDLVPMLRRAGAFTRVTQWSEVARELLGDA